MPAWLPVNERASTPMLLIAIASSAIEMRSPAVSSMSSSRGAGSGVTSCARSSSSSVVSPIADTATTTSLPALRVSTMRFATRLMLSASATDEPPNFCTMRLIWSFRNRTREVYRRHGAGFRRPHRVVPAVATGRRCCGLRMRSGRQAARRNGMSALFTVSGACSAG